MNLRTYTPILVASTLFVIAGCTSMTKTEQGVLSGAAIGAATGAGISALAGGNAGVGAVLGGALGSVAGGLYGNNKENKHYTNRKKN